MFTAKKVLFPIVFLAFYCAVSAQTTNWQWVATGGGAWNDRCWGVVTDDDGNSYIAGRTEHIATYGNYQLSGYSAFVAKLDPAGNWIWVRQVTGTGSYCYDIGYDGENGLYITGVFGTIAEFGSITLTDSGIFVARISTDGVWQWASKAECSENIRGTSITANSQGNVCLTGYFSGTAVFGGQSVTSLGHTDVFVAQIDSGGGWSWVTSGGSSSNDSGMGVALGPNSEVYVVGRYVGTAFFGGTTLESGSTNTFEILVAKLSSSGAWVWAESAGGASMDEASKVTVDDAGNLYVTGYFMETAGFGSHELISRGGKDIFVAKLDPNGTWLWVTQAGGTDMDSGSSIFTNSSGRIVTAGLFRGIAHFGTFTIGPSSDDPIYLAEIDASGTWLWVAYANSVCPENTVFVTLDPSGYALVGGFFNGPAWFGPITILNNGNADVFLAKYGFNQPKSPENLLISKSDNDIMLSWDEVTQGVNGLALTPDRYLIYVNIFGEPEGPFYYFGETQNNWYIHYDAALTEYGSILYQVTAEKD